MIVFMERIITITGVGATSTPPDQISVSIRLESQDLSYEKAEKEIREKTANLQQSVKDCGLPLENLKTANWYVRTITRLNKNQEEIFCGYHFRHLLEFHLNLNFSLLTRFLQSISDHHVCPALSIQFKLENPAAVKEELLVSATKDARKKAEILASASGVSLGKLLRIDYSWGEIQVSSPTRYEDGRFADMLYSFSKSNSMEDICPQEIKNQEHATFVWEIL